MIDKIIFLLGAFALGVTCIVSLIIIGTIAISEEEDDDYERRK